MFDDSCHYDGKCGLCSKEIRYYQQIPARTFVWYDIASHPHHLEPFNVSQEQALRRLHALTKEGSLVVGVDAFCTIWRELSGWRWLGMVVSLPVIRQCAQLGYNWFADYRFCKIATLPDSIEGLVQIAAPPAQTSFVKGHPE